MDSGLLTPRIFGRYPTSWEDLTSAGKCSLAFHWAVSLAPVIWPTRTYLATSSPWCAWAADSTMRSQTSFAWAYPNASAHSLSGIDISGTMEPRPAFRSGYWPTTAMDDTNKYVGGDDGRPSFVHSFVFPDSTASWIRSRVKRNWLSKEETRRLKSMGQPFCTT